MCRFRRSAWLVFDRPSQAADAKEALNLHQLHLSIPVDELLKQMNRIKGEFRFLIAQTCVVVHVVAVREQLRKRWR
jgi:hypothetical protein